MSFQITTAFVQAYRSGIELLLQQKGSRLRNTVSVDSGVVGKTAYYDQIGTVAAQKVTTRHADSPLNPTPHARRRLTMFDYDTGDLIDDFDKLKVLNDPSSEYVQAHSFALGRAVDDVVIAAALATAYTGEDGSTTVAFPSSQQIAHGGTGLTLAKLITARQMLDQAETDPEDPRFLVVTAEQISNLLNETELTSSDFATVKALVRGEINEFMRFNFVRTERLAKSSTTRSCLAYTRSGIKLGMAKDITARITERADKRFSWYAYACMSLGATRMQEEKVIEVQCTETA